MKKYLAIDIGASSGRHIMGSLEGGKIVTNEIYRFKNGVSRSPSRHLCWDLDALVESVICGIAEAKAYDAPDCIGVDTWGVDFVLLDSENQPIGESVCYRDERTEGSEELLAAFISSDELYSRTGIQANRINTINQLVSIKKTDPELFDRAEKLLFIPDYINFRLTGVLSCEYTNASTSGLLDAEKRDWDYDLIDRLGLPRRIFMPLTMPGTRIGLLSAEISARVGFDAEVILPATHDTGSAVLAVPSKESPLYISSGTWSLFGCELSFPERSETARALNFTNEGGFGGSYRFLKNIMGLWMIQSVKAECGLTFSEIENLAREHIDTLYRVDVNEDRFLAPASMSAEVRAALEVEISNAELFAVIYNSLADCYARAIDGLERLVGRLPDTINIVGGGSRDRLLCELTAKACKKPVLAGPVEATAIGNLAAQMICAGEVEDKETAREIIARSFEIKEYTAVG